MRDGLRRFLGAHLLVSSVCAGGAVFHFLLHHDMPHQLAIARARQPYRVLTLN